MSAARVEKLEALLARVAQRAGLPRPAFGVLPAAQFAAAPAALTAAVPPMRALAGSAPELTVDESEDYMDTDVEVSTEVVEVDVDEGDEQAIREDALAASAAHDEHQEQEEEERAPASSRRPVALSQEEEHDEYADNPPRHTPPPESGRQVAASAPSPAPPLASERRPSAPPEPQVGGWREPGLEAPRTPSVVPAPRPVVAPAASSGAAVTLSASPGQPIVGGPPGGPAQVMRPEIKPNAEVAKIEGEIAAAEESSFGDLLDSSLSI